MIDKTIKYVLGLLLAFAPAAICAQYTHPSKIESEAFQQEMSATMPDGEMLQSARTHNKVREQYETCRSATSSA